MNFHAIVVAVELAQFLIIFVVDAANRTLIVPDPEWSDQGSQPCRTVRKICR
jgi:hypothetical protein